MQYGNPVLQLPFDELPTPQPNSDKAMALTKRMGAKTAREEHFILFLLLPVNRPLIWQTAF
jgi:hypothetical protein